MWATKAWVMGQSIDHIEQWEQICQKNLFLGNFVIAFVEKYW